jgi:cytochrome c556
MKSLIYSASVMVLLVVIGVVSRTSVAADDGPATIDKIMETLHKGRKSPMATLKATLKSQSPDWATVQKETKTYAKYAADMPKNDPPKGDPAAYKTLAKAFATNAKALDDAAKKEDLAATKGALGKLGGSCMGCHNAHKED